MSQSIYRLNLGITKCYLLECSGGYLLIDTAYPRDSGKFEMVNLFLPRNLLGDGRPTTRCTHRTIENRFWWVIFLGRDFFSFIRRFSRAAGELGGVIQKKQETIMKRITENHQDYFFDIENANKYLNDAKNASKARFSNFLSSIKRLDIKGRYLEIGSGPGVLTQIIAKQHSNAKIIAYDISPEMIQLANQDLAENLKTRIEYKIGDACNINSMKDIGKFDLIYSTFTLHHWDNAELAIRNLYSMLNDNGLLYIHDLKRVIWLYHIKSKSGFFNSIRAAYRPGEIKTILKSLGIKNYKFKTIFPFFMLSIFIRK